MKANYLLLLTFFILLQNSSCASFRKEMIQIGDEKEAIQNAILDFSNTSGLYKKNNVFSLSYHDILYRMVLEKTDDGNGKWVEGEPYKKIVAVSISANSSKILITDSTKVGDKGKIPSRYFEQ